MNDKTDDPSFTIYLSLFPSIIMSAPTKLINSATMILHSTGSLKNMKASRAVIKGVKLDTMATSVKL